MGYDGGSRSGWGDVVGLVAFFVACAAVVWVLAAALLQFGWNIFVPPVLGLPAITMKQSMAAVVVLAVVGSFFTTKVKSQ